MITPQSYGLITRYCGIKINGYVTFLFVCLFAETITVTGHEQTLSLVIKDYLSLQDISECHFIADVNVMICNGVNHKYLKRNSTDRCYLLYLSEAAFPFAVGLTYRDGDDDLVLLVERNGRFIAPEDGCQHDRGVYVPQEQLAIATPEGSKYVRMYLLSFRLIKDVSVMSAGEVLRCYHHNTGLYLLRH